MRTLYFIQITDDRFDDDIRNLLEKRVQKIKELLDIDGVEVIISDIKNVYFEGNTVYHEDGNVAYQTKPNNQCRCRFRVRKTTRKVTWDDIYDLVNSVKAVPYSFNGFVA